MNEQINKKLNKLGKKIDKFNTLEKIEYIYYSENCSKKKEEKEKDNKGIK